MPDQTAVNQANHDMRIKEMNDQTLLAMAQETNNKILIEMAQNLNNWQPMAELPKHYSQFTYATLKTMFWKRSERPGLERCSRMIGKKLFICVPMFGLWLAGELPEQQDKAA